MRRARGEGNITLHKPSGRWQVKVSTGQHDAQGQLVFRYGSAKTQEDAVIVKRDLLRLIAEQRLPDQHRLTVKQYLEQWLEDKKGSWKLRTHELNTFYVTKYIVPCIGPVLLTKLSALQVSKMQGDILQKVGATTAVRARGLLVQALTQAERWNLVSRNIAKNVDPVKIEAREMSVWQPEQAQRFLEFARKHRLYPIIHLALTTGMRRGELLGLRWTDIKDGALRIAQSLTVAGDDSLRFSTPKTKKGIRRVPLDPETILLLEDHRRDPRLGLPLEPRRAVPSAQLLPRLEGAGRTVRAAVHPAPRPSAHVHQPDDLCRGGRALDCRPGWALETEHHDRQVRACF
jgi:integrase